MADPYTEGDRRYPPPPPARRRSGLLWIAVFLVFGFVASTVMVTCGQLLGRTSRISGQGRDPVGVIELTGPIMDTREVVEQVREFAARGDLLGLVVRIDSPGGAVAPSQELFDAVRRAAADKPVVTSIGNTAASGGMWVALAGDVIFASPGSITGSIGVIAQTPDLRAIADTIRLGIRTYKSGPLKDIGSPLREMTPADEAVFMGLISDVYAQFVDVVVDRRGLSRDAVLALADGRILTGRAAKEAGLVDELGGLYEAADKAVRLHREQKAAAEGRDLTDEERQEPVEPLLVYPEKRASSLLDLLVDGAGPSMSRGVEQLVRAAAEGVYRAGPSVELR